MNLRSIRGSFLIGVALVLTGCGCNSPSSTAATPQVAAPTADAHTSASPQAVTPTPASPQAPSPTAAAPKSALPAVTPTYTYAVVATFPHDPTAFTEGLFLQNGVLYESTGLNGQSTLRIEDLATNKITKEISLPDTYFGEGITDWNGKLYQLTWKDEIGFIYDDKTLAQKSSFSYEGEGWSLTHDAKSIIMDNGSDAITFRDPATFDIQRTIHVADHGTPVTQLNELEYVKGDIYANVWMTNFIVRIDPATGAVKAWIDLTGLEQHPEDSDAVLNGIAYDAAADKLYVTGKRWSHIYQITLTPKL